MTEQWEAVVEAMEALRGPAGICQFCNAHWDETHLYWYFSNLCEDRKKICKRVQHNISMITACDIQVIGVRPRGFLY